MAGPNFTSASEIISGAGALTKNGGGRWNPPGLFAALYLSDKPEVALAESLAHARRNGIPDHACLPKVVVDIEVCCDAMLDLTDAKVTATMPVDPSKLMAEAWWLLNDSGRESGTQALGRIAEDEGLHGLIVPSAAMAGTNLMLLPHRLPRRSCYVRVAKPDQLAQLGK